MSAHSTTTEEGNGTPLEVTPAVNLKRVTSDLENVRYDALSADYNSLPTYPTRPSYKEFHSRLSMSTQCVVFEGAPRDPHKPSSVPIYQTATFVQPSATEFGAYDYTRSGNPTRTALEKQVAMLEGAHAAFGFTSGMAALSAVTRLLRAGDELLVGEDIYGGMHRLVSRVTGALHGIKISFVDTTDLNKVAAAITPNTRMLHMETPSNPLMRITDVRALSEILKKHNILLSIDSTMMSPVLQKPLLLGADIVVHSATKFFGGHSDAMGGLVCLKDEELSKRIAFFQNAEGSGMDPFSCWLFLRGIKTLALRVERSSATALAVAEFLQNKCPYITKLFFPGLRPRAGDDPRAQRDHEIHYSQSRGAGCVMSFTTGNVALSRRLIDSLRIFKLTVSFGSVNSLCEMPCVLSHASIPADQRKLPDDLVRLSIGIEDPGDLISDLAQAFELAAHPHVTDVRSVRRKDTADEIDLHLPTPTAGGAAGGAAGGTSANGGSGNGSDGDAASTPSAREQDAAAIARTEVAKLAGMVKYLKDRLADAEARAAEVASHRVFGMGAGNSGNMITSPSSVSSTSQRLEGMPFYAASQSSSSAGMPPSTPRSFYPTNNNGAGSNAESSSNNNTDKSSSQQQQQQQIGPDGGKLIIAAAAAAGGTIAAVTGLIAIAAVIFVTTQKKK